jgi:ankyrin repeat protein
MSTPDNELADWAAILDEFGAEVLMCRHKLSADQLSELLTYRVTDGGTGWLTELVKLGADPNYRDDEGNTTLSLCIHRATSSGPFRVETFNTAVELLAIGADPDQCYSYNCSVTSLAKHFDRTDFVALFLLAGADLDKQEPDSNESLRDVLLASQNVTLRHLVTMVEQHHRVQAK